MQPECLISDTSPLAILSLLGADGLDLLLATPARLIITDAVLDELLEPPEPGSDPSLIRRAEIAAWLERRRNDGRVSEMSTNAGRLFRAAQANWKALGCPPDTRPSRKDLGEASVVSVLSALTERAGRERTVFVLMDDRAGRAAVRALGAANIDLMGTAAYLRVVEEKYGAVRAGEAWLAIAAVANERLDHGVLGDPVLIRR